MYNSSTSGGPLTSLFQSGLLYIRAGGDFNNNRNNNNKTLDNYYSNRRGPLRRPFNKDYLFYKL